MKCNRLLYTGVVICLLLSVFSPARVEALVFTVNDIGDQRDCKPGDGKCETAKDNGICTLRAAIEEANATGAADQIRFNAGPIRPSTPLPAISKPLTIDGRFGAGKVELDGIGTRSADGIRINAGPTTIKNMAINRFAENGISVFVAPPAPVGPIILESNLIGTNVTGAMKLANGSGIAISSANVTVGGTTAAQRNIVSGNNFAGIVISANNVQVRGNYIGTDATGMNAVGNGSAGISITGKNNTIGGALPGEGNIISANADGIRIEGGNAQNNRVEGNYIGTNKTGKGALPNKRHGVRIEDASSNTIGGAKPVIGVCNGPCNLISGNDKGAAVWITQSTRAAQNVVQGNFIGTDITGSVDLGNATGVKILNAGDNTVGGTTGNVGNVISGNGYEGVTDLQGFGIGIISADVAPGNRIQGNYIGTSANGLDPLGNHRDGVYISTSENCVIGGPQIGARNIISANNGHGILMKLSDHVLIEGNFIGTDAGGTKRLGNAGHGLGIGVSNDTVARGNVVSANLDDGIVIGGSTRCRLEGNFVGTDPGGTKDLGNDDNGILIGKGYENIVGGNIPARRNLISGNHGHGIELEGGFTFGNQVMGNFIGTDITGTLAIENTGRGILINGASGNVIGGGNRNPGACDGECNLISGNRLDGVGIGGTDARKNQVMGNFIGTNLAGNGALGNGKDGIALENAPDNTIGGIEPPNRQGNLISGNGHHGILIKSAGAEGNQIQGNLIGTDNTGAGRLGNQSHGLWITSGAKNNMIGGTEPNMGNTIAFNAGDGVFVNSGVGNSILRNAIFANTGLGIDLDADGVTPNDTEPGDSDGGANNLQNFPVLSSVSGMTRAVLNSTPKRKFRLEFFSNVSCDPCEYGEGRQFLLSQVVETNEGGNALFESTMPGRNITATATAIDPESDLTKSTSEFSRCLDSTIVPFDFGDAPQGPYLTTVSTNGAHHAAVGPCLGRLRDQELDGQPDATATGDDNNGADDEDGVVFPSPLVEGSTAEISVTVSGPGRLNAWLDFNSDGDWADGGEQIFDNESLTEGTRKLSFTVPAGALPGLTFARFRFSTQGGLTFIGAARDGEVEDYQVEIKEKGMVEKPAGRAGSGESQEPETLPKRNEEGWETVISVD